MSDQLKIAIAQLDPLVGDIEGNLEMARLAHAEAAAAGADLIVFSELFITGYPPEDLVLKPAFQQETKEALVDLAHLTANGEPAIIMGAPWLDKGALYNAALLLADGTIQAQRYKVHLPNYGVFDELRIFAPGPMPGPINFKGIRLGVMVCEDLWFDDVPECLQETGAEIFVVLNGSPFSVTKFDERLQHAVARVTETALPLLYVNQVGGQDELVFDGASFALNADGSLAAQLPSWESVVSISEWRRDEQGWLCTEGEKALREEGLEAIYLATMCGLRDYVEKNRFPGLVLGLSGGIDSALSAAIAVDALGAERVHCLMMPSRYTGKASLKDAADCAEALGVQFDTISIEGTVKAVETMMSPAFAGTTPDATEENIQSRLRALVLMAMSNKFGKMLLTTGNKSEVSVGYTTLYGDMCGGYNALKDIYKTEIFALAKWRNTHLAKTARGPRGKVIPQNIIDKPPSAELRSDQKDEDTLPPYHVLDDILKCLVESDMSFKQVVARGHDPDIVKRIEHLLYVAEYKRRQAPPGVKISPKNFGRDRRYPITNGFRDAR